MNYLFTLAPLWFQYEIFHLLYINPQVNQKTIPLYNIIVIIITIIIYNGSDLNWIIIII